MAQNPFAAITGFPDVEEEISSNLPPPGNLQKASYNGKYYIFDTKGQDVDEASRQFVTGQLPPLRQYKNAESMEADYSKMTSAPAINTADTAWPIKQETTPTEQAQVEETFEQRRAKLLEEITPKQKEVGIIDKTLSYGKAFATLYRLTNLEKEYSQLSYDLMEGQLSEQGKSRLKFLGTEIDEQVKGTKKDPYVIKAMASVAPWMVNALEKGATGYMKGAIVGGTAAAIAGQLGPQAAFPEEVLTVPAAAAIGGKIGALFETTDDMRKAEAGSHYAEMRRSGVSHGVARAFAHAYSFGSVGLETLQLGILARMIPGGEKVISNVVSESVHQFVQGMAKNRAARILGMNVAGGVAEGVVEGSQQVTQNFLTILAKKFNDSLEGTNLSPQTKKQYWNALKDGVADSFKQTALGVSLLHAPVAGARIALGRRKKAEQSEENVRRDIDQEINDLFSRNQAEMDQYFDPDKPASFYREEGEYNRPDYSPEFIAQEQKAQDQDKFQGLKSRAEEKKSQFQSDLEQAEAEDEADAARVRQRMAEYQQDQIALRFAGMFADAVRQTSDVGRKAPLGQADMLPVVAQRPDFITGPKGTEAQNLADLPQTPIWQGPRQLTAGPQGNLPVVAPLTFLGSTSGVSATPEQIAEVEQAAARGQTAEQGAPAPGVEGLSPENYGGYYGQGRVLGEGIPVPSEFEGSTGPSEALGSTISQTPTQDMPSQIQQAGPPVAPPAEEGYKGPERRSREYIPTTKQETMELFPEGKGTKELIGHYQTNEGLYEDPKTGNRKFKTFKQAEKVAKKIGGTVVPAHSTGEFVVVKEPLGRVKHLQTVATENIKRVEDSIPKGVLATPNKVGSALAANVVEEEVALGKNEETSQVGTGPLYYSNLKEVKGLKRNLKKPAVLLSDGTLVEGREVGNSAAERADEIAAVTRKAERVAAEKTSVLRKAGSQETVTIKRIPDSSTIAPEDGKTIPDTVPAIGFLQDAQEGTNGRPIFVPMVQLVNQLDFDMPIRNKAYEKKKDLAVKIEKEKKQESSKIEKAKTQAEQAAPILARNAGAYSGANRKRIINSLRGRFPNISVDQIESAFDGAVQASAMTPSVLNAKTVEMQDRNFKAGLAQITNKVLREDLHGTRRKTETAEKTGVGRTVELNEQLDSTVSTTESPTVYTAPTQEEAPKVVPGTTKILTGEAAKKYAASKGIVTTKALTESQKLSLADRQKWNAYNKAIAQREMLMKEGKTDAANKVKIPPKPESRKTKFKKTRTTVFKDGIKKINDILGEKGQIGGVDPGKLNQLKPVFQEMWVEAKAAGQDVSTFIREVVVAAGEGVRVYLQNWMQNDLKIEGTLPVPSRVKPGEGALGPGRPATVLKGRALREATKKEKLFTKKVTERGEAALMKEWPPGDPRTIEFVEDARQNGLTVSPKGNPNTDVWNNYTGARLQAQKNGWDIIPVGQSQFVVIDLNRGETPEAIGRAAAYRMKPPVPQTPVNVGGKVPEVQSVADQIAAEKERQVEAELKAIEEADKSREVTLATRALHQKEAETLSYPAPHQSVAARSTEADIGSAIKAESTSAFEATLVSQSGLVEEKMNTMYPDRRLPFLQEVKKRAKEGKYGKVVITESSKKGNAPSKNHTIKSIVVQTFWRAAESLKSDKGTWTISDKVRDAASPPRLKEGFLSAASSAAIDGEKLIKALDVEYAWKKMGAPQVGLAIKNWFGRRAVEQRRGEEQSVQFMDLLGKTFQNPSDTDLGNIVLSAEDENHFRSMPAEWQKKARDAVTWLRKYFENAREEFKTRNLNLQFKDRLLAKWKAKIDKATEKGKTELAAQYQGIYNDIDQNFEFIHIPYQMLMDSRMRALDTTRDQMVKAESVRQLRSMLSHVRRAPNLKSLVTPDKNGESSLKIEDLNPYEIILNYAYNKGLDHAMLDVRDAAIAIKGEDGKPLIVKVSSKQPAQEGNHFWVAVNGTTDIFNTIMTNEQKQKGKKVWLRSDLAIGLQDNINYNEHKGLWQKGTAIAKAAVFTNPIVMPSMNLIQMGMGGAFFPKLLWNQGKKTWNDIGGIMAFLNHQAFAPTSANYKEAFGKYGLGGDISNNPFRTEADFAKYLRGETTAGNKSYTAQMARLIFNEYIDHIKRNPKTAVLTLTINAMTKMIYNAINQATWTLEGFTRMLMYNHVLDQGHTKEFAADIANKALGDYASVPAKTRKTLNKFLFTPTYKIAVGKFLAETVKHTINTMSTEEGRSNLLSTLPGMERKNDSASKQQRRWIYAAFGTAISAAIIKSAMMATGWKEDEFLRKWYKDIDTKEGKKRVYITWASPINIPSKFLTKFYKAFNPDAGDTRNFFQRGWGAFKYELTPLITAMYNAVQNKDNDNKPIVNAYDDNTTALKKYAMYGVGVFAQFWKDMYQNLYEEERGESRHLAANYFKKEYGSFANALVDLMFFTYTSDIPKKQMATAMVRAANQFKRDQKEAYKKHGKPNEEWLQNYTKARQEMMKVFQEGAK